MNRNVIANVVCIILLILCQIGAVKDSEEFKFGLSLNAEMLGKLSHCQIADILTLTQHPPPGTTLSFS